MRTGPGADRWWSAAAPKRLHDLKGQPRLFCKRDSKLPRPPLELPTTSDISVNQCDFAEMGRRAVFLTGSQSVAFRDSLNGEFGLQCPVLRTTLLWLLPWRKARIGRAATHAENSLMEVPESRPEVVKRGSSGLTPFAALPAMVQAGPIVTIKP